MKSRGLGAAVLVALSGIANAADCGQFGGGYAGGNVGWGTYKHEFADRDGLGETLDTGIPKYVSSSGSNFVAGVQGGYNRQRGCSLLGVEADLSWSGMKTSSVSYDGDQNPFVTADALTVASKLQWFGTLRARAGVIVDDTLVFVTGGLAYANFKRDFTYFQDGPISNRTFSSDVNKFGWAVGAGAEVKWSERWTVKGDFLFMQFKSDTMKVSGDGVGIGNAGVQYPLESSDSAWVMRLAANYRF